ncbi:protocatechuate 3,4-dioxygenase subunit alpha [Cognatishimia sp. SS12]|uniref:protocatechuate 3,4-dioxygenase subunit alpha n=1 Tax=Cognatishimia sp. SS12 TaxID=2979465 RepID=UPI00232FAFBC|nr:protocatechuate 3,4-dioxygenase subunit alpha [Cognatishimia sp. SS12]MDC0739318.1 protocatechuate 3,4-dioxygenase subunit alpha [Cognatishimia sp. SS12]
MQKLNLLKESPSQTAGPYVHIGCVPNFSGIHGVYPEDLGAVMRREGAKGQPITIKGAVWDGTGTPLKDALVEVWQPDADGIFTSGDPRGAGDPNFSGWGRFAGDYDTGEWAFETVKPGPVPFPDGRMQAPNITFWVVARGINIGLQTRMYFPDEDNSADPVLGRMEHKNRVPTLIAQKESEGVYRFDIRLQGHKETVFFDV